MTMCVSPWFLRIAQTQRSQCLTSKDSDNLNGKTSRFRYWKKTPAALARYSPPSSLSTWMALGPIMAIETSGEKRQATELSLLFGVRSLLPRCRSYLQETVYNLLFSTNVASARAKCPRLQLLSPLLLTDGKSCGHKALGLNESESPLCSTAQFAQRRAINRKHTMDQSPNDFPQPERGLVSSLAGCIWCIWGGVESLWPFRTF